MQTFEIDIQAKKKRIFLRRNSNKKRIKKKSLAVCVCVYVCTYFKYPNRYSISFIRLKSSSEEENREQNEKKKKRKPNEFYSICYFHIQN